MTSIHYLPLSEIALELEYQTDATPPFSKISKGMQRLSRGLGLFGLSTNREARDQSSETHTGIKEVALRVPGGLVVGVRGILLEGVDAVHSA